MPVSESKKAIEDLGVAYQLVTDETSMIVLSDEGFKKHGIDRKNQDRTHLEQQAQSLRYQQPIVNHRVDSSSPMFNSPSPSFSNGGGAIDPLTFASLLGFLSIGIWARRRK